MNARRRLCLVGLSATVMVLASTQASWAQAPADGPLRIVSASYGRPNAANARNFSARLQQTCGDNAVVCQSFCSKNMTGAAPGLIPGMGLVPAVRVPFMAHPVCRVVYRCGEGITRASETDDGDIIALSCRPGR